LQNLDVFPLKPLWVLEVTMSIGNPNFDQISETDLIGLINVGVPEGLYRFPRTLKMVSKVAPGTLIFKI